MCLAESCDDRDVWLTRLGSRLKEQRYSCRARNYESAARRFFDYLRRKGLTVHTVQPADIQNHLQALRRRRKDPGRTGLTKSWRNQNRTAIHMLLRLVHGKWPLDRLQHTDQERFHYEIIEEYRGWMKDLRGLSKMTQHNRCVEAERFLDWLGERGSRESLSTLTVVDIDAYVRWRVSSLRRSSKKTLTVNLRSLLRHMHGCGQIRDVASAMIAPKLYALEGIPSALRADEIEKVLQSVHQDRSPVGLRDYAILTLLSTYGLRAGEITALRLEDIDWSHDRLRILHSKTGVHSELPLLPEVGEAILDYLRKGRPQSNDREVFLCSVAPYRPIPEGSNLYSQLANRMKAAGVTPKGKKGPHAYRHAKAAALLRSAVPLKVIGDVLGHRATQSTMTYLKLDLEELRRVALEIPGAQP
ncbi:MAG: tyrosine-type recombinase/integrase [Terriglobia bacterium]